MSAALKRGLLNTAHENQYITYINDKSIHLLNSVLDEDRVYFINLNDSHKNNSLRSFTVKFNIGINTCPPNLKKIQTPPNQVFLSTRQKIEKNHSVPGSIQSICIDISTSTFEKAFYETKKRNRFADGYSAEYFIYPNFFEHGYNLEDFPASLKLTVLKDALRDANADLSFIDHNWFAAFAQDIVLGEYDFFFKTKKPQFD